MVHAGIRGAPNTIRINTYQYASNGSHHWCYNFPERYRRFSHTESGDCEAGIFGSDRPAVRPMPREPGGWRQAHGLRPEV